LERNLSPHDDIIVVPAILTASVIVSHSGLSDRGVF
jgi:hypothetical protein